MRRRLEWSMALRSRQGSQALVEFGLVAILFVMILFAIVDFGLLLNGWMTVNAGAREAARQAAVGGHVTSAIFPAAERYGPPGVRGSDLKVTANYCPRTPGRCYDYYNHDPRNDPMPAPYTCTDPPDQCTDPVDPVDPDPLDPNGFPAVQPGFSVTVIVVADTFQVVTPLVRPFFGCDGARSVCPVTLVGKATMRYEGPQP